jgi:predicted XRE-type DNA-binding protein
LTQKEVRDKFVAKTNAMRQKNISEATGIPREILSKFLNGKRDLYPKSLEALNDYLNNY